MVGFVLHVLRFQRDVLQAPGFWVQENQPWSAGGERLPVWARNIGRSWQNHGKTMGRSMRKVWEETWEKYGNIIGKSWEETWEKYGNHGKNQGKKIHENSICHHMISDALCMEYVRQLGH